MKRPDGRQLVQLSRKGAELALRQVALAPDQRAARSLAEQRSGLDIEADGKRVLIMSPRDWAYHNMVEGLIGTALSLRGADVAFVGCGGGLEVCDRVNVTEGPPMPCGTCNRYVQGTLDAFGFPHVRLSDGWGDEVPWPELDELSAQELPAVQYRGVPIGELMQIPVRWFLLASTAELDPLHASFYRKFLRSARRVVDGFSAALDRFEPDVVLALSGLFSFESVALWMCRDRGIDVVTYERTYQAGELIFSRGNAASHFHTTEAWEQFGAVALDPHEEAELDGYLLSRRSGGHPIFNFWNDATRATDRPSDGRMAVLFTNVTWDSAVIGRERAFESFHAWLDAVVELMRDRPRDHLVIRVHPAETRMPGKQTREPVVEYLQDRHEDLPANVAVIGPEESVSSYDLMEQADVGLVLTSICGLELALTGTPVVVAGIPHYHQRGFTLDAGSSHEWRHLVESVLDDPASFAPDVELTRRYAHLFFHRIPIALPQVAEPVPGLARLTTTTVDELRPGCDPGLDLICDGLLHGGNFMTAPTAAVAAP